MRYSQIDVIAIDDEVIYGNVILEALSHQWTVRLFHDSLTALRHMACLNPRVVVSDVRMPGLNGLMLASEIRRTHPNVKIILISAQITNDCPVTKRLLLPYTDRWLAKPFRMAELQEIIIDLLNT